jgi:hypothetical protein
MMNGNLLHRSARCWLAALTIPCAATLLTHAYTIPWYTIDGGGGHSSSNSYDLHGTIGQHDAGEPQAGGTFELRGGFWTSTTGATAPGDCDFNGLIDFADFNQLENCHLGPDNGISGSCECLDLDSDSHISMADFAIFQKIYTGP